MKEIIFKISDGLYNDETGEVVFKPEVVGELIRCKDCKWKPELEVIHVFGIDDKTIVFPEDNWRCPCRCDDELYNNIPDDNWYCANAERLGK